MPFVDFQQNPFIVIWEVTRACQLACQHCRAAAQPRRDPRELTTDEGKRLIRLIAAMGQPLFVLSGGDPLERPDLFELIEYGVEQGLRVSLTPSATPRVTRKAMVRAKAAGLSRWAFSLDGSTPQIHDAFRGVPGSFDLTMQAIEWLQELELPIQINSTVCKDNLDDLATLAQKVEELGAVLWSVFFLVPIGRGQVQDMISPEEHEQVFHWLYELAQVAPFDLKTTAAQHYRRVVVQRRAADRNNSADRNRSTAQRKAQQATGRTVTADRLTANDLGAPTADEKVGGIGRAPQGVNDGKGFLFISHIGDVFPSGFLPIVCGNVRTEDPGAIYRDSTVFQSLRDPGQYRGKCGYCEYRHICGGSRARAYAMTGDYLESEPFCTHIPDPRRA